MKKSEAIQKCVTWIKNNNEVHYMPFEKQWEFVLDFLVYELGMSPPERVRYTDLPNGKTLCSPECSWEDEDGE